MLTQILHFMSRRKKLKVAAIKIHSCTLESTSSQMRYKSCSIPSFGTFPEGSEFAMMFSSYSNSQALVNLDLRDPLRGYSY